MSLKDLDKEKVIRFPDPDILREKRKEKEEIEKHKVLFKYLYGIDSKKRKSTKHSVKDESSI